MFHLNFSQTSRISADSAIGQRGLIPVSSTAGARKSPLRNFPHCRSRRKKAGTEPAECRTRARTSVHEGAPMCVSIYFFIVSKFQSIVPIKNPSVIMLAIANVTDKSIVLPPLFFIIIMGTVIIPSIFTLAHKFRRKRGIL